MFLFLLKTARRLSLLPLRGLPTNENEILKDGCHVNMINVHLDKRLKLL